MDVDWADPCGPSRLHYQQNNVHRWRCDDMLESQSVWNLKIVEVFVTMRLDTLLVFVCVSVWRATGHRSAHITGHKVETYKQSRYIFIICSNNNNNTLICIEDFPSASSHVSRRLLKNVTSDVDITHNDFQEFMI